MFLNSELHTFTFLKSHSGCCRGEDRKQGEHAEVRHKLGDHPPSNRNTQKA